MKRLRVGTRGSDLSLRQTRYVLELLRAVDKSFSFVEVIIKTHGDLSPSQPINEDWPMGGFVGAIEQALRAGDVDFAVHSYKDLPTVSTPGLMIFAVPPRESVHDVLITGGPVDLANIPRGFRVGTSSPRRAAQLHYFVSQGVEIVPIRGNVPTRVGKVEEGTLDGVVLAVAGLNRLGLRPRHMIDLSVDRFVPAPAQGALAVQARHDGDFVDLLRAVDHVPSRRCVEAERSFLGAVGPGCHTPVGGLAVLEGERVRLHGQLFYPNVGSIDPTYERKKQLMVEGIETGDKPSVIGLTLGRRLLEELRMANSE